MRIAVLSDVHGNVPALTAVLADLQAWRPDLLVVNGDLINRGPCSGDCLALLRQECPGALLLRGNHENFVLRSAIDPASPADWDYDLRRLGEWCGEQLGAESLAEVAGWADHLDLTGLEGGASLHVTHGSRLGDRTGIHARLDDQALAERLGDPRDLFIGSHTHKPLRRAFRGRLVLNTGSVGQPLDGDHRAAYARCELHLGQWQAQIRRVPFDTVQALRDCEQSGFLDGAGPMARLILRELQTARAQIAPWRNRYLERVRGGGMPVADSVAAYLADPD